MAEISPWQRLDGTIKGPGFDAYYSSQTGLMTEFSLGDPKVGIPMYPSIYQGILPWEMETLANVVRYGYDPLQYQVYDRAFEAASERQASGLPLFWTPQDGEPGMPLELVRRRDYYK